MKTFFHHVRRDNLSDRTWATIVQGELSKAASYNQVELVVRRGTVVKDTLDSNRITDFTVCIIEDDNRNEISRGYSFCSAADQFSKKRGRQISRGRAMKMARQKGVTLANAN